MTTTPNSLTPAQIQFEDALASKHLVHGSYAVVPMELDDIVWLSDDICLVVSSPASSATFVKAHTERRGTDKQKLAWAFQKYRWISYASMSLNKVGISIRYLPYNMFRAEAAFNRITAELKATPAAEVLHRIDVATATSSVILSK